MADTLWPLEPFGGRLAVFGVEIPFSPDRLLTLQQHPMPSAHVAVEILHPQLLAALAPLPKLLDRTEEAIIFADLDGHTEMCPPAPHLLRQTPFSAFGGDDGGGSALGNRPGELAPQALRVLRVIQRDVTHLEPLLPQLVGKVPHGGEEKGDLLLVVLHIGRFAHDFRHQHERVLRIRIGKRRQRMAELVTEHEMDARCLHHSIG